jgi:hypothetical protein
MMENKIVNTVLKAYGSDIERVRADNQRMRESDIGADEMKGLLTGKVKKPRAIRNAEKTYGGG